jgi:hypothetical protein
MGIVKNIDPYKTVINQFKDFDWVYETPETEVYFLHLGHKMINGILTTEDESFLRSILKQSKYQFYLLVCEKPIQELECMLVLRKLGYAHWNQYYFNNMDFDKLNGLVKKGIKELALEEKLKQMNEDFVETKIVETPLTTPQYITILE